MTLPDPGALDDPLVGRLDADRREIGIGEDRGRDTAAGRRNVRDRSLHDAPLLLAAAARESRRPMWSFILLSNARTAALIAFLIAAGDDLPWQMMLTPRTPRSGAPPCSE